jgi:hypothetical protein
MSKEKIEILKNKLEELSQQRKEVEARDRELEEQEKPMREKWEQEKLRLEKQQQEKLEASKKLKTEIEELRKAYLKEPEENLKKAQELVEKLSNDVQLYKRLYQESQERLLAINRDLSDPMKSFLQTPEMEFDPNNPLNPITPSQIATKTLLDLEYFCEYAENLKKRAEKNTKDIEWYKEKLEATKVDLESAKKESLEIESRLESAKIAFSENSEYFKLKAQLNELETQKQELDIQKRELYNKIHERDLTTREKISQLEGERVEKEHQLKLQLEEARIKLENFNLELGKKSNLQKILAEEFNLATSQEEKEALQKVQKSTEKRIEVLQDEISHYVQIFMPQQEPSSSSSYYSYSASSMPSSYSSSNSSSSASTASEMRSFSSSESPIILVLNSNFNGSVTSEEVSPTGDVSHEESNLDL